jgi:putative membrane protein
MMLNLLSILPFLALVVKLVDLLPVLATTLIFVVIGLVVFALAYLIIVLVSPFSVKKEIEDDQNSALAIIIGAIIIGVAMIISAAIQGN